MNDIIKGVLIYMNEKLKYDNYFDISIMEENLVLIDNIR